MDFSTPGLPVHHQLLEFTQTHVHWVGNAIQPSYPLSSPSPLTFSLSQLEYYLLSTGVKMFLPPEVAEAKVQARGDGWFCCEDNALSMLGSVIYMTLVWISGRSFALKYNLYNAESSVSTMMMYSALHYLTINISCSWLVLGKSLINCST